MQNNKFIFLEQQKIAIKLSLALELTLEEFKDLNQKQNALLNQHLDKAKEEKQPIKYQLPESESIYYKDFHFLEEPLIEK